jgi:hypothetical protein
MVERARREHVDEMMAMQLSGIERQVAKVSRQTAVTMAALCCMVAFAALEYAGILHGGSPPIWARAVFDGLSIALGK